MTDSPDIMNLSDKAPGPGWFALGISRDKPRSRIWTAVQVDVHPDELKHCVCKFAWLFVHPNDYRPVPGRVAHELIVRVPGQHRNEDAAWDALQDMLATRH